MKAGRMRERRPHARPVSEPPAITDAVPSLTKSGRLAGGIKPNWGYLQGYSSRKTRLTHSKINTLETR